MLLSDEVKSKDDGITRNEDRRLSQNLCDVEMQCIFIAEHKGSLCII